MKVNLPAKWSPSKVRAIEYMTAYPNAKMEEVADESGVTSSTVYLWLRDPEFVEVFYQKYMISFGARLPKVLNAMIREAESGNVQAGRLILEHSGKLIKRVEVNNYQSPFEKFLDKEGEPEFEEVEEAEFTVLPQRPIVETKEKPATKAEELSKIRKKKHTLELRREADKWRRRAENANVEKLPQGRKTKLQMHLWHQKIIKKEKELLKT